ncbi:DUF6090 family protein [Algoriphagus namhaensis]|uniref:DUF6090 family protein n=1 Tax=Algoriphagus namhaensis TaxID=915353 RepID=A0ABV8AS94_9BACT
MIKFFRKIRQNLLLENKTGKYFKYAIGEIVLVVIGILIALQINNWNENRKDRIIEKEILTELIATTKSNHESLLKGLKSWESTTKSLNLIIQIIDQRLPYADSLAGYFKEAHRKRGNNLNGLNFSGYKSLENRGYHLIRNPELRKEIINLFEQRLSRLSATNNQVDIDNGSFYYEYIAKNFRLDDKGHIPHSYQSLLDDPFYYSILKGLESSMDRKKNRVRDFLFINKQVLELLETELSILN